MAATTCYTVHFKNICALGLLHLQRLIYGRKFSFWQQVLSYKYQYKYQYLERKYKYQYLYQVQQDWLLLMLLKYYKCLVHNIFSYRNPHCRYGSRISI